MTSARWLARAASGQAALRSSSGIASPDSVSPSTLSPGIERSRATGCLAKRCRARRCRWKSAAPPDRTPPAPTILPRSCRPASSAFQPTADDNARVELHRRGPESGGVGRTAAPCGRDGTSATRVRGEPFGIAWPRLEIGIARPVLGARGHVVAIATRNSSVRCGPLMYSCNSPRGCTTKLPGLTSTVPVGVASCRRPESRSKFRWRWGAGGWG